MSNAPIGIFDSGIGGLTVARAIARSLPNESTIYFGDTARVPYGPKSPDTVRRYSREIAGWLESEGVKLIVVACNTATAHALDELQQQMRVPVIGVIEPGARAASQLSAGTVGVIGTAGTMASGAYRRALEQQRTGLRIVQQACPLFVPLVEEGWFDHPATRIIAEEYLRPINEAQVDTLVLGCTHYPMLAPLIQQVAGQVRLVDSAEATASAAAEVLHKQDICADADNFVTRRWIASDDAERFARVGALFLGQAPRPVELVDLGAGNSSERV